MAATTSLLSPGFRYFLGSQSCSPLPPLTSSGMDCATLSIHACEELGNWRCKTLRVCLKTSNEAMPDCQIWHMCQVFPAYWLGFDNPSQRKMSFQTASKG